MALDQSDIEWLNGKVRYEVEQAVKPLLATLAEQEAELDRLTDCVWALNVVTGLLRDLLPADQAWEAAQTIQSELDMAVPSQRDSMPGQTLQAYRKALLQLAVHRPAT